MGTDYISAKSRYADFGVDTDKVLKNLEEIPLSMHCWQGDDVGGFETADALLSGGGIQTTGNFPGKSRNVDELRSDIAFALKFIPGKTRLNLHAIYGEFGGKKVDRSEISYSNFAGWVDWCKSKKLGIDFNPSYFSHQLASDGFTLSSADKSVREFWIAHGIACRKIAERIGQELDNTVITNFWMPDGMKDFPADRLSFRERMADSLDRIFASKISTKYNKDAVECKLFGIGSESYVVGSHEFFMGYAVKNQKLLTLDSGHFHPTETIADKISSMLMFVPEILLHVSRGVRWDSDHVVVSDDATISAMQEVVRCGAVDKVHIGMDFFDASINRIFAWVVGMRAARKSLMLALLDPIEMMRQAESELDYGKRLTLIEESKNLPSSAIWDEFCRRTDTVGGLEMINLIKDYEASTLLKR